MILLYSFVLMILASIAWLVQRYAARIGRRYSTLAVGVHQLVRELSTKPGNSARVDLGVMAKSQLALALLVDRRDRAEARHFAWQAGAERLGRWTQRLRVWKGQKLPYTMGVVDVWLLLAGIDHLGFGEIVNARQLVALASTFLGWE